MTDGEAGSRPDAQRLRIHAFPDGTDFWRIDWFGPIAYPNRSLKRSEPSVLVHLSKVIDTEAVVGPDQIICPASTSTSQRKCWVSIGTTVLLRIGDIWEGRRWYSRPAHQSEQFSGVTISRETAKVVKAGSSLESGGFLIPAAQHPWHMGNTHSYCVRVTLDDGRYLVVPAMELIRFYFGGSSPMLSRLFMPPLTKGRLFEDMKYSGLRRMTLDLAEGIPGASATAVARIAGDPLAWHAAQQIGVSCLAASTRQADVYPIGLFPFLGSTDLKVHGQWLPRDGQRDGTFLVYRIASCSHAFPFRALTYRIKNARSRRDAGVAADDSGGAKSASVRARKPIVREQDGSGRFSRQIFPFDSGRAFPDLTRKAVNTESRLGGSSNGMTGSSGAPVAEVASGEPTSSQRVRSVSFAEYVRTKREPAPEFLQPAIDAFKRLDGVDIRLLTEGTDGWTVPAIAHAPDDFDAAAEIRLYVEEDSGLRLRRLSAFRLQRAGDGSIVVFIESEPLQPRVYALESAEGEGDSSEAVLPRAVGDFARSKAPSGQS